MFEQQWDSDLVEARYIKDLDENLSIIRLRYGDNAKPLFRNREFIVYERRDTMNDGTVVTDQYSMNCNWYFKSYKFDMKVKMMIVYYILGGSNSFIAKGNSSRIATKAE